MIKETSAIGPPMHTDIMMKPRKRFKNPFQTENCCASERVTALMIKPHISNPKNPMESPIANNSLISSEGGHLRKKEVMKRPPNAQQKKTHKPTRRKTIQALTTHRPIPIFRQATAQSI